MRKVISTSPKKNLEMVVYHNVLPNGKKESLTRFEALDETRHQYKRPFLGKKSL